MMISKKVSSFWIAENYTNDELNAILSAMSVEDWKVCINMDYPRVARDQREILRNQMLRDMISGNDGVSCKGYSLYLTARDSSILDDISKNDSLAKLTIRADDMHDCRVLASSYLISLTVSDSMRCINIPHYPNALIFDAPEINMLTSLTLRCCHLTNKHIQKISEMKQLRLNYLNISENPSVEGAIDSLTKILQSMPLKYLDVSGTRTTLSNILSMFDIPDTCDSLESLCCQDQDPEYIEILPPRVMSFEKCYNLQSLKISHLRNAASIVCPMSLTKIDIEFAFARRMEASVDLGTVLSWLVGTNVTSCTLSTHIDSLTVSFTQPNLILEELSIETCSRPVNSYIENMLDMLLNLKHVEINEMLSGRVFADCEIYYAAKLKPIILTKSPQMETFTVVASAPACQARKIFSFHQNNHANITLWSLCSAMINS
jgi:hypothetical protein